MDMTQRVQRWLASTWGSRGQDTQAQEALAPPVDLEAIRQAMRLATGPCSHEHRARAAGQIARASTVIELWLLRSTLYQYLAQDLGQAAAASRVDSLLPLFGPAVPGAASGRGNADNAAHGQRLH
ncbi:MAG: hypothetical protein KIS62_04340 [Ramlibacter sp.]|nr:hypothetical protein [Ramlibacter sp.]